MLRRSALQALQALLHLATASPQWCSVSEIAEARQTKAGTIKAQLNSIYKKANVTGRMQLLSLFVEELFTEKLVSQFEKMGIFLRGFKARNENWL